MYSPTLEQARAYAADYKCVPVCRAILSDMRTPIEVPVSYTHLTLPTT